MAEGNSMEMGNMDYAQIGGRRGNSTFMIYLVLILLIVEQIGDSHPPEANSNRREVGDLAVWTLSSAKPGNGVEQIRDDSTTTFWQ
jgi:hypothetical protein